LEKYYQNMIWKRNKLQDIWKRYDGSSHRQLFQQSPFAYFWFLFKRTFGILMYDYPFIFIFLAMFIQSPSPQQFFIFFLGGLGLSSQLSSMVGDMVNYRESKTLHKYLDELEINKIMLQPFEIEDYIQDKKALERLRLNRPSNLRNDQKLGRVMRMKMPTGIMMASAKAFIISGSRNVFGLSKVRTLSLIFIHDEPNQLTTFGKFMFFHELSHLTVRSFIIRERKYLYQLIPGVILLLFVSIFSWDSLYLILFFIPYFIIINLNNNKADRSFFDEIYCDLYAIDSFTDAKELNRLKQLLPKIAARRFESNEVLSEGAAYSVTKDDIIPFYLSIIEEKLLGKDQWGTLETNSVFINEGIKTISCLIFVAASFYITPLTDYKSLLVFIGLVIIYNIYVRYIQVITNNKLNIRIDGLIHENPLSVQ